MKEDKSSAALERLTQVVAALRGEGGCPWDREQTHRTLRPHLIEEAWEVAEAIDGHDMRALAEELGDLLLQVVFHSQLAKETGDFTLEDVIGLITEKLLRRHPHVFNRENQAGLPWDPSGTLSSEMVTQNWEEIKKREKKDIGAGRLEGVSKALPALVWTQKVQDKAAGVGFDWKEPRDVLVKVREELEEVAEVYATGSEVRIEEEIGDLLFTVVNLARHLNLSAEVSLRGSGEKFMRRFRHMERTAAARGLELTVLSPAEWEEFWGEAKGNLGFDKET